MSPACRFSIRKRTHVNKGGLVAVYDVICVCGKGHQNALQLAARLNALRIPRDQTEGNELSSGDEAQPKTGEQVNRP